MTPYVQQTVSLWVKSSSSVNPAFKINGGAMISQNIGTGSNNPCPTFPPCSPRPDAWHSAVPCALPLASAMYALLLCNLLASTPFGPLSPHVLG